MRYLRKCRTAASLVAIAGIMACGSDRASAPQSPIKLTIGFDNIPAVPGQIVTATISATPTDGSSIRFIRVVTHGLVARTDSIPFTGSGAQTSTLQYSLPFRVGSLIVSAVAGSDSRTGSLEDTLQISDNTSPTIVSASATLTKNLDSVQVILSGTDNAAITGVAVQFAGAFTALDSLPSAFRRSIVDTIGYAVPPDADFSKQLSVSVDLYDVGGNRAHQDLGQFALSDKAPPAIHSVFLDANGQPATLPSAPSYRPGDVAQLRLDVSDNTGLAWVGYRIGDPVNVADSVAVEGTKYTATRTLSLSAASLGVSPVTFFASDKFGNRDSVIAPSLSVYQVVARPTAGVDLPGGNIADAVVDAKRGVVYLAQPDSDRILVLSTTTMTFSAPIATPGYPTGLDLTASGDSLVIALRRTTTLGIVDLTRAQPTLETIPLEIHELQPGTHDGPYKLRVSAANRVLLVLTFDGSGWEPMQEFDLTTLKQRERPDAAFLNGVVESDSRVAVSGDRSRLVLFMGGGCCPNYALMYGSATDAFASWKGTTDTAEPAISLDNTGEHILISSSLFDAALKPVAVYQPPHFDLAHGGYNDPMATVIAPTGDVAYISVNTAYYVVRLSDGGVLEQVFLPTRTTRLLTANGGATLLSLGASRVDAVALR